MNVAVKGDTSYFIISVLVPKGLPGILWLYFQMSNTLICKPLSPFSEFQYEKTILGKIEKQINTLQRPEKKSIYNNKIAEIGKKALVIPGRSGTCL